MNDQPGNWRYKWLTYTCLVNLAVTFVVLNVISHNHGQHANESMALRLSITLPELIVWAVATASAMRFKRYAFSIKNGPDGRGLNHIANSMILLVLYVISLSTMDSFERLFLGSRFLQTAVVIGNHLPLLFLLASGLLLNIGSNHLAKQVKGQVLRQSQAVLIGLFTVSVFLLFAWQFYRAVPQLPANDGVPRFVLSAKLLLVTYVLPHIIAWSLGILACLNLAHYATKTKGTIYKMLLGHLYRGLILVFACIFLSQMIIISGVRLNSFSFLMLLIYGVLLLAIVGFMWVFNGTKDLEKIEKAPTTKLQELTTGKSLS